MAASDYPNVVVKSGVAVAAVPVENKKEQRKYFGTVLTSKGYLPVFLVIDNHTSNSYLLAKEDLSYGPAGAPRSDLGDPSKPSKSDTAIKVMQYVPLFPVGLIAMAVVSNSFQPQENLLNKELQSTTISPGASAHGFIFIPVRWKGSSRNKIDLNVPMGISGSSQSVAFHLTI
jgi:hypothetical protein